MGRGAGDQVAGGRLTFSKGNKHGKGWKARKRRFSSPETYEKRFWKKVNKTETCWLWTAAKHSAGYGVFRINGNPGTLLYAHRYSYELVKGSIPAGLHLDHLCRVRNCVNPDHLEPVTPQENNRRGLACLKEFCRKGHAMSGANAYIRPDTGGRQCLACKHEYFGRWYAENRKAKKPEVIEGESLETV